MEVLMQNKQEKNSNFFQKGAGKLRVPDADRNRIQDRNVRG